MQEDSRLDSYGFDFNSNFTTCTVFRYLVCLCELLFPMHLTENVIKPILYGCCEY